MLRAIYPTLSVAGIGFCLILCAVRLGKRADAIRELVRGRMKLRTNYGQGARRYTGFATVGN